SGRKAAPTNCLATTHPHLAAEWHSTKNGSLTPQGVVAGSSARDWWKCRRADDHEWQSKISHAPNGRGSRCCAGWRVVASNSLIVTNPDLAGQWQPFKNGSLGPGEVLAGSRKKVWWRCQHGHEWEALLVDRKNGRGCPYCARQRVDSKNCLAVTHPALAAEWHPIKNADLTPRDVLAGSNKEVWWKCPKVEDHEWQ